MTGARPVSRTAPLLAALLLGACRSVDPSLGLALATPAEPPQASAALSATAVAAEPIQFLPVVGIPADRAPALAAALANAAAGAGVSILPAQDGVAGQRLKGYLSTVGDPGGTLVVYVWDVVDPAGNRIDRIQGQVRAAGTGGKSWAGVDERTLQTLARETIAALPSHARVASRQGD